MSAHASVNAFRIRNRRSNSFQVLDQILLIAITELQVELRIVVVDHVEQRGEPSIVVESTLLPANGAVRYMCVGDRSAWKESTPISEGACRLLPGSVNSGGT
jgi:hypothetical protein